MCVRYSGDRLVASADRSEEASEVELVRRLRSGDEEAFASLVTRHHAAMVRLALTYVRTRPVAEEVAQDAWLGLLRGIDRFEGRSSLRTWLFRIVVNRAITAGVRERVHLPVDDSELEQSDGRFSQDGWWVTPPTHWADDALERISTPGLASRVRAADRAPARRTAEGGNAAGRPRTQQRRGVRDPRCHRGQPARPAAPWPYADP